MSIFFNHSFTLDRNVSSCSPAIFGKQETEWMCRLPSTEEMERVMQGEKGGEEEEDMLSQVYGKTDQTDYCVMSTSFNVNGFTYDIDCTITRR